MVFHARGIPAETVYAGVQVIIGGDPPCTSSVQLRLDRRAVDVKVADQD
jgi:hypothetical protein